MWGKASKALTPDYCISFITKTFILIFRALIVRKEEREAGEQKKQLSFAPSQNAEKLHIFNLMTTCSVIVASTLTTHRNVSKWCWHEVTSHSTKHPTNIERKPWRGCVNDSSPSEFWDGVICEWVSILSASHPDFSTSLSFPSVWSFTCSKLNKTQTEGLHQELNIL